VWPEAKDRFPAPAWLDPFAREEWSRLEPLLRDLGLLTAGYLPCFAAYCTEFGVFREAQAELSRRPKASLKAKAQLLGARRKAAGEMRKWAAEFGLTPCAAERVSGGPLEPEDPVDKYTSPRGPAFSLSRPSLSVRPS
jgi:P27 family predicted phage terminase small subunit